MRTYFLLFILLVVATLTGCNGGDDISSENNRTTLQAFHDVTRVSFDGEASEWNEGDCLKVFVDGLDDVYTFNYDATSADNFVCDNLTMPAEQNDVYALYGIDESNIVVSDKTASVALAAATQTQGKAYPTAHIADYDILYGKALGVGRDNIQVAMAHTVAAVKINISNSLLDATEIKSVKVTAPEDVVLAGGHTINLSTDEITPNEAAANNSVTLTFEKSVTIAADGSCTAWIATAPFNLAEGDNLVIDITTMDDVVYRCTKTATIEGISFGAGSIMSTDIVLGRNAKIVIEDTPEETMQIVIDFSNMDIFPKTFPKSKISKIKNGEYTIDGYDFTFNSSVPFYVQNNRMIRFNGITSTKTASILLPRISGYVLDRVTLASVDINDNRDCYFAVLENLSDEITTENSQILTSEHHTYDVTLSGPDADCYVYIYHKMSNTGIYADLTYISLTYSKVE